MKINGFRWFKIIYRKTVTSIAFLPAVIALLFLFLAFIMINFDFSETGKNFKKSLHWLSLKDATTARSIVSAITNGLISLTVFSFSMVMILLVQAASQMSNRILDKLIGNRFQQFVLGFYIGTIVYALFLLSTIRDIDSGIYIPAISVYFLIACTVIDIFLFIYFLHYITQSVKYETIINRIHDDTMRALERTCTLTSTPQEKETEKEKRGIALPAPKSGLYQGYIADELLEICRRENITVKISVTVGDFLLKGTTVLELNGKEYPGEDLKNEVAETLNIYRGQEIINSYYYGFRQLMEIAIKALSPGINDPGTAGISLRALADLFLYRFRHFPHTSFADKDGIIRIETRQKSPDDMLREYLFPIWDYGKNDRNIQLDILNIIGQLKLFAKEPALDELYNAARAAKIHHDHL